MECSISYIGARLFNTLIVKFPVTTKEEKMYFWLAQTLGEIELFYLVKKSRIRIRLNPTRIRKPASLYGKQAPLDI